MKRVLLFLFLVLVLAGAWFGFSEYNRTAKSLTTATPALTRAALDLIKDFETDSSAAGKKYNDQVIDVSGTIKKIAADGNPVVIFLGDAAQMSSVQCSMDSTDVQHYQPLKVGSTTTLKGRITGFRTDPLFGTDVILNRCVVATQP